MRKYQLNDYGEIVGGWQAYTSAGQEELEAKRRARLLRVMRQACKRELTPRQQQMVQLYFFENLTMPMIAHRLGVNKSTVSRCIGAAKRRIAPCVRYFM